MRNKILKICTLGALSVLGLCACDDIVAKPSDYNSEIVTVDGFKEQIYNDIMSVIYDGIHDSGNFGGDVLEELLFQYATSVVGKYNVATKDARNSARISADNITLKTANNGITVTGLGTVTYVATADAQKFIDNHKAYWSIDPSTGKRVTTEEGKQLEYARVKAKWATIEERIAEKMYEDYTSGSYSDRNYYSEWRYLRNLASTMAKVQSPYDNFTASKGYTTFISPDVEPSEVFTAGILTRSYYQTTAASAEDVLPSGSTLNTYVEDEIIPDIYRQLLVEQYLYDNSYNTLGGSYARKVNIIKIADQANYPKAAKSLMEYEVSLINAEPTGTTLAVDNTNNNFEAEGLAQFKNISKIWTGVDLSSEQEAVLNNLQKQNGFTKKSVKSIYSGNVEEYWGGTEYGKVLDDYAKIKIDDKLNESTVESDFTSSGTYDIETGKEIKKNQVRTNDHTTTGWYIKNGGLSDLPDSIRTRLFSVGVSNSLDLKDANGHNADEYDRWQYDSTQSKWVYNKDNDYNSYVARINGRYYLKNDKVLSEDNENGYNDVLFYDTSSSTYYVVQVLEAVTTSKLSKTSSKSYAQIRGVDKMSEIINDVLKVVGTGESYETTSTKYWLEKAGISYHDQEVYDYFKTNYPDLFD